MDIWALCSISKAPARAQTGCPNARLSEVFIHSLGVVYWICVPHANYWFGIIGLDWLSHCIQIVPNLNWGSTMHIIVLYTNCMLYRYALGPHTHTHTHLFMHHTEWSRWKEEKREVKRQTQWHPVYWMNDKNTKKTRKTSHCIVQGALNCVGNLYLMHMEAFGIFNFLLNPL